MKITEKTRYALKILLDIAYYNDAGPVQRRHIASRQSIPTDYMDHILTSLKNSGLLQSLRGREGGYHLCLSPEEISLWDIQNAVEDVHHSHTLQSVPISHGSCAVKGTKIIKNHLTSYAAKYLTDPAWEYVTSSLEAEMRSLTIDLILKEIEQDMSRKGITTANYLRWDSSHQIAHFS